MYSKTYVNQIIIIFVEDVYKTKVKRMVSSRTKGIKEWEKAYSKGVNRGNWPLAVKHFGRAAIILAKSPNPEDKALSRKAYALSYLYYALLTQSANSWMKCSKQMETLGNVKIEIPYEAVASEVAEEARLKALEVQVRPKLEVIKEVNGEGAVELVKALKEIGSGYLTLRRPLVLNGLLGVEENPVTKGQGYLGLALMLEARLKEDVDPESSAELYSKALSYLSASSSKYVSLVESRLSSMVKVAQCWICGRKFQGEGVNFYKLDLSPSRYLQTTVDEEASDEECIYICRTCYEVVTLVSRRIWEPQYRKLISEFRRVEANLSSRISALESRTYG